MATHSSILAWRILWAEARSQERRGNHPEPAVRPSVTLGGLLHQRRQKALQSEEGWVSGSSAVRFWGDALWGSWEPIILSPV